MARTEQSDILQEKEVSFCLAEQLVSSGALEPEDADFLQNFMQSMSGDDEINTVLQQTPFHW